MVRLNEMNEDLRRTNKNKTTCVMYKKCNNLPGVLKNNALMRFNCTSDISINGYITSNTEWRKSYEYM